MISYRVRPNNSIWNGYEQSIYGLPGFRDVKTDHRGGGETGPDESGQS